MRFALLASGLVAALCVPPALAADAEWQSLGEGIPALEAKAGAVSFRITMERRLGELVPVVTVREGGSVRLTMVGEASGFDFPQGDAAFLEMDPSAPGPEVAFTSFSGGAHCCTSVRVARRDADGTWSEVRMGNWDGGGHEVLRDADGDGVTELVTVDNAFLYVFDCYACSEAPLVVLALRDGEVEDVSAEPRFLPEHRSWLAEIEARQAEFGEGRKSPGFWAGWIAAKVRVGEGADAWATFERDYQPDPEDDVEDCTVAADVCPEANVIRTPFPQALKQFLSDAGYPVGP